MNSLAFWSFELKNEQRQDRGKQTGQDQPSPSPCQSISAPEDEEPCQTEENEDEREDIGSPSPSLKAVQMQGIHMVQEGPP